VVKILSALMTPAAAIWKRRATVLEATGAACLIIAGSFIGPADHVEHRRGLPRAQGAHHQRGPPVTVLGKLLRLNPNDPTLPLTSLALSDWLTGGVRSTAGVSVTEQRVPRPPRLLPGPRRHRVQPRHHALPGLQAGRPRARAAAHRPRQPQPAPDPVRVLDDDLRQRHRVGQRLPAASSATAPAPSARSGPSTRPASRSSRSTLSGPTPAGKLFHVIDVKTGKTVTYTPDEHLPTCPIMSTDGVQGVRPMQLFRQALGDRHRRRRVPPPRSSGTAASSTGVLTTDKKLEQGAVDRLKASWKAKLSGPQNAGDIAILDSGAKFQPITSPAG